MTAPAERAKLSLARELGARGSRNPVGEADPAGPLPASACDVLAVVPAWWEAQARAFGLSGRWLDLEQALDASAPEAAGGGSRTKRLDLVTSTAEDLGAAYVASLDAGVRARHGRHYTPPQLSVRLWTMTRASLGLVRGRLGPLPGLLRDPACGAGALLLPPVREHVQALAHSDPRVTLAGIPNLVEGIDADPAAVWLTNVVLAAELLPLVALVPEARRRPLPALARVGDGLEAQERSARAVVMNPPYGRVRLAPDERARFADVLYGHANLYTLFMGAGVEQLDAKGVLGALVPTSFLAGRYFSNLRTTLAATAPLRDATFVEERDGVFAGVLQETCLAVFSRRKARKVSVASMNGRVVDVAKLAAPRGGAPWLLPRRSDDAPIAAAAAAMPLNLGATGWRASTGPLVWNRRRADLADEAGEGRCPIIWAADLDGGRLHRDPSRDAFRYITLRDDRDAEVLALRSPAILVQRTTAPEQARRVVAAELTEDDLHRWGGQVVVENHVNVLRPRDPNTAPIVSRGLLCAVLATECIDRVVRCVSGSVALSAYELEALPLPPPDVLRSWEGLRGAVLESAVHRAYRLG
ncbi:Eco57I restriction-modification methylase domain-containing protein [Paraconexibacter algicola]|nr:Eco57I restriction-modification methylase domain-containing protein [Paraconexibacter algicola]